MSKLRATVSLSWVLEIESKNYETAYEELKNYFAQNNNFKLHRNEVEFDLIDEKKTEPEVPAKQEEVLANQGGTNGENSEIQSGEVSGSSSRDGSG